MVAQVGPDLLIPALTCESATVAEALRWRVRRWRFTSRIRLVKFRYPGDI